MKITIIVETSWNSAQTYPHPQRKCRNTWQEDAATWNWNLRMYATFLNCGGRNFFNLAYVYQLERFRTNSRCVTILCKNAHSILFKGWHTSGQTNTTYLSANVNHASRSRYVGNELLLCLDDKLSSTNISHSCQENDTTVNASPLVYLIWYRVSNWTSQMWLSRTLSSEENWQAQSLHASTVHT